MLDYDELEPGRELDILVAEAMGWKLVETWYGDPIAEGWVGYWDDTWPRWIEFPRNDDDDDDDVAPFWSPSTDTATALDLLDNFTDVEIEKTGDNWSCLLYETMALVTRPTLAHAICISILKTRDSYYAL
jgi:hypothetical protein